MGRWTVSCAGCGHHWHRVGVTSDLERREIESRPCPCCGLYTLRCPEPKPAPRRQRPVLGREEPTPGRRAA